MSLGVADGWSGWLDLLTLLTNIAGWKIHHFYGIYRDVHGLYCFQGG